MRKSKGFTLIELLVVISVIALLMAILMPSLQKARKQAMAVACQSNLKQWGLYFSMYTSDNNGMFQKGWWSGQDYSGTWVAVLRPYYQGGEKALCCPTATKPLSETIQDLDLNYSGHPFVAWGIYNAEQRPSFANLSGSYGINAWVRSPPFAMDQTNAERPTKNNWRTPDTRGADKVPVLGGAQYYAGYPLLSDTPPDYDGQAYVGTSNYMTSFSVNRHNGSMGMLFMDWSARRVGLKELWRLKWHRSFPIDAPAPTWPVWMAGLKEY